MIIKRTAKKTGNSAHVIVPAELSDKTVYVVSDKDALDLKELIERTLLLRKIDAFDKEEFNKDYEEFKREIRARLTALEIVYKKPNQDQL